MKGKLFVAVEKSRNLKGEDVLLLFNDSETAVRFEHPADMQCVKMGIPLIVDPDTERETKINVDAFTACVNGKRVYEYEDADIIYVDARVIQKECHN